MINLESYEKDISENIDSIYKEIKLHASESFDDWSSLVTICRNKLLGIIEFLNSYEYEISTAGGLALLVHGDSFSKLKERFHNLESWITSKENSIYEETCQSFAEKTVEDEGTLVSTSDDSICQGDEESMDARFSIPVFTPKKASFSLYCEKDDLRKENSEDQKNEEARVL